MEGPWRTLATAMVVITIAISTGLGTLGVIALADSGHATCRQVNSLRVAVTQVLVNSEKALPSNPYFKHRPDALRAAEAEIRYDLTLFRPVTC